MTIPHRLTAEEIAHALGGKRTGENQWKACCPAHDDRSPSLSIGERDGRVLVKCWAGCTQSEVIDALVARGLWARSRGSRRDGFSRGDVLAMRAFVEIFEADCRRGAKPTPQERERYRAYCAGLGRDGRIFDV